MYSDKIPGYTLIMRLFNDVYTVAYAPQYKTEQASIIDKAAKRMMFYPKIVLFYICRFANRHRIDV